MTPRQRVAEVSLWVALVLVGVVLGASAYQRISLIPEWSGALPDSLVLYFRGTRAGDSIGRFWSSVLPVTALVMVVTLVANWRDGARRKWVGWAALLFFAMLVWTEAYFVPKGVVPLMVRGGEGLSNEEIVRIARAWVFWDWFRMAGTLAAYLALLKAATSASGASREVAAQAA